MKKIFTLVLVLCIAFASNAQSLSKGNYLVGGSLGFTKQRSTATGEETVKNNIFSLYPSVGKFYRNNKAVGVNLSYANSKSSDDSYKLDGYGIGLFLRQYLPLGKSFYLFAEEGAGFQSAKIEQEQPLFATHNSTKQSTVSIHLFPGISYSITKKMQVELALQNLINLGYQKQDQTNKPLNGGPETKSSTSAFYFLTQSGQTSLGNLSVGVRWVL